MGSSPTSSMTLTCHAVAHVDFSSSDQHTMQCQGTVSNVPVWTSDEAIGSHWMDKAAEHSASRTCAQAWVMTAMTATAEDDNTDPRTEDNAIFVRSGGKTIVTIFRCGLQKIFLLSAGGRLPSWHVLPNSPWSYQGRQPQGCARRRHSQVGCARTATCLTHSCGWLSNPAQHPEARESNRV